MRKVKIEWAEPLSPKEVQGKEGNIYRFYGYHPVYGDNVLLYICGAYEWSGEGILDHKNIKRTRIPSHFKPEQIKISVGEIFYNNKNKVCLEIIKEILVFLHSPAWNTEGIDDIRVSRAFCDDVLIFNTGYDVKEKGGLRPIVKGEDCYVRKRKR